jgi:hypothetical protein
VGLVELIVTVCALSLPNQCEDRHLSFLADMSLNQCVMNAPLYIAQWTNEHPKWFAVRWRCDYGRLQAENLEQISVGWNRGDSQGFVDERVWRH